LENVFGFLGVWLKGTEEELIFLLYVAVSQ